MTDKNTPAFPCAKSEYNSSNQYGEPHQVGMTLRDYFAAHADVSGIKFETSTKAAEWAGIKDPDPSNINEILDFTFKINAIMRYRLADAMLAARDK